MSAKSKKKKGQQSAKKFKPEDYLRSKARMLPIYKCYKAINPYEDREMAVVVIRQHPQGTFTTGAYMLDKWCLGVKDSFWQFNASEDDMKQLLSFFSERLDDLEEIDYVAAHNWVYGAHDFAEVAGIKPCKDFALTKYILEEDDDDVELIEYDFGREGEYCLVAKNRMEASKYTPILDKTLGKGNYSVEIGLLDDDVYDSVDDDADYRYPFEPVPSMNYTYEGKDYPTEITLHYPEVETIVKKTMDTITDDEMETVLSLPEALLREDLHNLVMRGIGRQRDMTWGELDSTNEWCVVSNAFMFLTKIGTVEETLPIVFEVMRQDQLFQDYNFGDISDILLSPVLCVMVKDNPRLLLPYLLEPGLHYSFKLVALELLEHIAQYCEDVRQEIFDMIVEILAEYKKDLPVRQICDGTVAAFAMGVLIGNGAKEYLPLIEELYATGMIDEGCEGHIEEVRRTILHPHVSFDLPAMDPYGVREEYRRFVSSKM